jgi:hypothetical protein
MGWIRDPVNLILDPDLGAKKHWIWIRYTGLIPIRMYRNA